MLCRPSSLSGRRRPSKACICGKCFGQGFASTLSKSHAVYCSPYRKQPRVKPQMRFAFRKRFRGAVVLLGFTALVWCSSYTGLRKTYFAGEARGFPRNRTIGGIVSCLLYRSKTDSRRVRKQPGNRARACLCNPKLHIGCQSQPATYKRRKALSTGSHLVTQPFLRGSNALEPRCFALRAGELGSRTGDMFPTAAGAFNISSNAVRWLSVVGFVPGSTL